MIIVPILTTSFMRNVLYFEVGSEGVKEVTSSKYVKRNNGDQEWRVSSC